MQILLKFLNLTSYLPSRDITVEMTASIMTNTNLFNGIPYNRVSKFRKNFSQRFVWGDFVKMLEL